VTGPQKSEGIGRVPHVRQSVRGPKTKGAAPTNAFTQSTSNANPTHLTDTDRALESTILELLSHRGPGKTICPSDAARLLKPNGWEELMVKTRAAAKRLVAEGRIVITQRGKVIDPSNVKGAIRLRIR
jgi:hypothetical protein